MMRFTKILSVCLGLLFVVGLQLNVNSGVLGAGNPLQKTAFVADGGHPLPPPTIVDGGHPLPPPMIVDGGHPLPPPASTSFQFGTQA
jgi:hypothetical protein